MQFFFGGKFALFMQWKKLKLAKALARDFKSLEILFSLEVFLNVLFILLLFSLDEISRNTCI